MRPGPMLLLILDGWGYSPHTRGNAIANARTPVWDMLWRDHPHTLIATGGAAVGLPEGQMGNSEVGHMNLGAGRVVYQDFTRITQAIRDGSFQTNPVLLHGIDVAVAAGRAVHIMGLLSPGGVHSHESHIHAALELVASRGAQRIYVHAFLDGRDTAPRSAAASLSAVERKLTHLGRGRIVSIIGRYFAMDRDQRWDRVEQAYRMLARGQSEYRAATASAALEQAYQRGENDEFVKATVVAGDGESVIRVSDGDALLFMNFRADRARELSHAFADTRFDHFDRGPRIAANLVCLTEYEHGLAAPVAFAPQSLDNGLGEYLSGLGKRQLRIAETEKYAHVTFFFNGGREQPLAGEERVLIPSPQVATYDLQPTMSAVELTDRLVDAVVGGDFDVIICNYANPDMVGHTGVFEAAVEAVETIDLCLGRVLDALRESGGQMLLTADHGNVEQMVDPGNGQPFTAHTTNPVPLVLVGRQAALRSGGTLADVAPTMLALMKLPVPDEMSGQSLLVPV